MVVGRSNNNLADPQRVAVYRGATRKWAGAFQNRPQCARTAGREVQYDADRGPEVIRKRRHHPLERLDTAGRRAYHDYVSAGSDFVEHTKRVHCDQRTLTFGKGARASAQQLAATRSPEVALQPFFGEKRPVGQGGSTVGQLIVSDDPRLPVPAQFAIRTVGGEQQELRILVAGELDLETSPQLELALKQGIATADRVLLDLSQVEFIDSTGVQAILVGVRESQANGDNLRIRSSLAPQAEKLFRLVGLLDRLPLVED